MVAQFTQQQQQQAPHQASPNLSPAQWAQIQQVIQQQPQTGYQPQAAQPSTSAYTSSGMYANIDPALLQAQWASLQPGMLPTGAVIPQQQYAPNYQQYAPPQSEQYLSVNQIADITDYLVAADRAAVAASQYILYLENIVIEHGNLAEFSQNQHDLIQAFLFDRDFAMEYARYGWTAKPIDDNFAAKLANFYMELHEQTPFGIAKYREEMASKPMNFDAQVPYPHRQTPQQPAYSIPPLPNSGGNGYQAVTMDQMMQAAQSGQLGNARAAAMRDPSNLYAQLLQQQ